jgi:hypothetical protein
LARKCRSWEFAIQTQLLKAAIGGGLASGRLADVLDISFLEATTLGYAINRLMDGEPVVAALLEKLVANKDKLDQTEIDAFAHAVETRCKPEQAIYYLRRAYSKYDLKFGGNKAMRDVIRRYKNVMIDA